MPIAVVRDVRLHYVQVAQQESVNSEDVVMVHGLAAHLGFWYFAYAPVLSSRYRVTLIDLRGHGLSDTPRQGYGPARMAEDVLGLMDQLGIRCAHLIGHSFGGAVLTHLACRHPDRVLSLTLADTRLRALQSARVRPGEEANWQFLERMARKRVSQNNAKQDAFLFSGAGGARSAKRWLHLLDATSARQDLADGDSLTTNELAGLDLPILAVYGGRSPALASGQALSLINPRTHLVVIPDAGHFFPMTRREALISALNSFLPGKFMDV